MPRFDNKFEGPAAVVAPKSDAKTAPTEIGIAELSDAYANRCDLHVYVRIEYQDVFSASQLHHHEMCVKVILSGDPAVIDPQQLPQVVELQADGDQNSTA
jgi:hypothetical protein